MADQLELFGIRVVGQLVDVPFGSAFAGLFQFLGHDNVIAERAKGYHAIDGNIAILRLFHLSLEPLLFFWIVRVLDANLKIAKRVEMLDNRRELPRASGQSILCQLCQLPNSASPGNNNTFPLSINSIASARLRLLVRLFMRNAKGAELNSQS